MPCAFTYICVTSAHYNSSLWDWNKIKMHLQGIWHHNNISIDLVRLHKHVQAIQNSHDEIISPAKTGKRILDDLKEFNPWNMLKNTAWYLIGFLCVLLILSCFFSVISKLLQFQGTTSYAKCLAKRHIESRLVQQANLGACVAERREDWFQQLFPAR
ncbi:hypothetical protein QTO34_004861 [Cnephaeus nilssonii]|uniref:Retroviral envelope protein GP41-like domain-containing protein n=1 Tax=Cnephaeus nilssonii TaxID=3371016 RepID=A0AA40HQ06_CNENI|nr:hypothetical protein QTO34_004861 [Eptesicus nilssonii]